MPTKVQLESELHDLRRQLALAKARLAAVEHQFIEMDGREYIALPLTQEERDALGDRLGDTVSCLAGEGDVISEADGGYDAGGWTTYHLTTDYLGRGVVAVDEVLPRFAGLFIHYGLNRRDGSSVYGVWGLRLVTRPA